MLQALFSAAARQGVERHKIPHWIHRKYGDLIVHRILQNGDFGTSFPCVLCRKALDKSSVQWRAHIGPQWIRSTDADLPKSRPTHKQVTKLGFLPCPVVI
jgi:hypothetical protein